MKKLVSAIASILLVNSVFATTYYVNAARPDDSGNGLGWNTAKKTIQAAVNASVEGDSVVVTNGVYAPITTANKAITIQSMNGADVTIIDGANSQRCATLGPVPGETNTNLIGFTLRNGFVSGGHGGGVLGGTLFNCSIVNNVSQIGWLAGDLVGGNGAGAHDSILNNCLVMHNNAGYVGGGVRGGILNNCLVAYNIANHGGGTCDGIIVNCTIVNNSARYTGGGSQSGYLTNCIVFYNTAPSGANYLNDKPFSHSCTTPLPSGIGNIAVDPMFRDSANSDYRLQGTSPCYDKGTNAPVQSVVDLDGNPRIIYGIVDMGAYEFVNFPELGLPANTVGLCGTTPGSGLEVSNQVVVIKGSVMGHSASSGFTFSPTGAGRLTFRWNVSSEYYYDALSFYVDDVLTAQISGKNVTWASVTNTVLTSGPHTFKWEYAKDGDTSVGQDAAWISDVVWTPRSALTVENGSGDGVYFIGDVIPVTADVAPEHFTFDRWTGDTNGVADVFAPSTQFTMPGMAALLSATYTPMLFSLSVTHGTGDGSYTNAQTIEITADLISGKTFYQWTGDTATVADVTASSTSVSIPGVALSLTATYRVPLTVTGGEGSGLFPEQTTVGIAAATPPEGMVFDRWTGDIATVTDAFAATTTVTMPLTGISLTATYAYSIPLVVGDGSLNFSKTGIESSVIVAPGMGPSGGPAICFTNLLDSQSAGLETVVQGAGKILFQWRVGSEAEADFLLLKVDGVMQSSYSGKNKPWMALTNSVAGPGPHVLRWEYAKDESGAVAPDAGWLGNILWIPAMTDTTMPVPYVWLDQYPELLSHAGGNYDAAALEDVDLDGHTAMQEYVSGSIPTNRVSILRAHIERDEGFAHITWTPDLGAQRIYAIDGKTNLTDTVWHSPTNAGSKFFRVTVEMP